MVFLKINNVVEKLLEWVIPDGYEGLCICVYVIIFGYACVYYPPLIFIGFGFLFLILTIDFMADIEKLKSGQK